MSGAERSERRGAPEDPARPNAGPRSEGEGIEADEPARDPSQAEAESLADLDGDIEAATEAATDDADGDGEGREEEAATAGDSVSHMEADRDRYLELAQRTQADFDNYRKRAARDVASAGSRAKAELARAILPAVDNLERALASAGEDEGALADGLRLVLAELLGALEQSGVAIIDPSGQPFDPTLHEALSTRSENGAEAGVVLDVVQKGYRLDQNVLRPARVVVAA